MRFVVVLVIGLFMGLAIAMSLANALQRRQAWPRGLMHVMQHDLAAAREAARGQQCSTPQMAQRAERLRLVAAELQPALLPADSQDRVLTQYIEQLASEAANWDTAYACPVQAEALTRIGHACDACHRDYR